MPCNKVEWSMILLNGIIKPVRLVYNIPIRMQILINMSHRVQEVSWICQPMTPQWTQFRQIPPGTPNLCDIASCNRISRAQTNSKSNAAGYHAYLTRLNKQHTHFRLNIQIAQLRYNQKVSICIAKRPMIHIRVNHENVQRNALTQIWITAPG